MADDNTEEELPDSTPVIEWVIAALGAGMFIAGLVYLVYTGVTEPDGPADIRLIARVSPDNPKRVDFTARNVGSTTAAQVLVKGEIRNGDTVVDESETVLDYVPEGSNAEGSLLFSEDAAGQSLSLRVGGFSKP